MSMFVVKSILIQVNGHVMDLSIGHTATFVVKIFCYLT